MADKYIIQKATEFSKQKAEFKKLHTLDGLARTHIAQRKYDGCHMVVRMGTDGHIDLLSRTGEDVLSCDHIGEQCQFAFDRGWVIFGEVWREKTPFPEISGMFRRHNPEPTLKFVPYDIVPSGSFALGIHDVPYSLRMKHLYSRLRHAQAGCPSLVECEYYPPGTYSSPAELACQVVARGGYDGLILRDLDAHWHKAEAKNGELIKVKPVMSLDLRIVEVHKDKGERTGRDVYTLSVEYRGVISKVGSGVPHDIGDIARMQIAEIECMGTTADGKLREPRFKGIRHDKLEAD